MRSQPLIQTPLDPLCRPAPLIALGVLLCNDHVFKGAGVLPPIATGKLSDFAGLFLFPILLAVALRALRAAVRPGLDRADARARPASFDRVGPILAAVVTGAGFIAVKMWPAFNRALADIWGENVMDASDLVAVPMVVVAVMWLRVHDDRAISAREDASPPSRPVRTVVAVLAVIACVATSPPRFPRQFPYWEVAGRSQEIVCARITPGVSKSGKRGVGLTLVVRGLAQQGCRVRIAAARLYLFSASAGDRRADGAPTESAPAIEFRPDLDPQKPLPVAVDVEAGQAAQLYLPFLFDNNDMWNRHLRQGRFAIDLIVAGKIQETWHVPAVHRLDGFHIDRWSRHQRPQPSYMAR